jgi:hypothetical protein
MFDQDPKQMKWVESLPASQEAEEWLKKLKAPAQVGIPALLSLLQWAAEEGAEKYNLDETTARAVLDDLLYITIALKKPKAAVKIFLNLDNPEEELPPEILSESEEELAIRMLELAKMARQ